MSLPIEAVLPDILRALTTSNMCVLQAPPGAGKTTRVPLALADAGFFDGKIVMLEPRRLAARAAAERLAEQRGEAVGASVGYAMRGANTTHKGSRIDVVTEGVLTRMIQTDPALTGVSAILFDEFHERSLQADLGLAMALEMRDVLRPDLCLIVMSATLDAEPVAALMGNAPIVTSEGRSFPVSIEHLDRPWRQPGRRGKRFEDAMTDLIDHAVQSTQGSILAFLPGVGEIKRVEGLLRKRLPTVIEIRPLYGTLPFKDQRRAIAAGPGRKVVLATSVAETSLTIEGISVVVDGGLARRGRFDPASGMQSLVTERVTKAEATQRTGRAGRLQAGNCFRLWTKGEEGGLAAQPLPEILSSDLMGFVLELALWGDLTAENLPLLTRPRDTDLNAAIALLRDLGALDAQDKLTEAGKVMARMPIHPRLAKLLVTGGTAQIAALLEARDILERNGVSLPADLSLREAALRDPVQFERDTPYRANRGAIERVKQEAKRLTGGPKAALSLGQMAALAYPDRIALRRKGDAPRFLMANGAGAALDPTDPMASARMIVATDLDGDRKDATIRLAAPFSEAELKEIYPDQIVAQQTCFWDKRERRVKALEQTRFGALALSESRWADCPDEARAVALLEGIRDVGITSLPWSKSANLLRARIEWARSSGQDLPDCSDEGLVSTLEEWLLPHIGGRSTLEALGNLDLTSLLVARLDWQQQQALDALAPQAVLAPTGTKMAIDYSGAQPKMSVRLQELFGLNVHPTLGQNRLPVLIELLSPAGRPVQMTSDLPTFWASSYDDVRKDMRGRYPKHPWPEDPANAAPTRRRKPRGT